MQVVPFGLGGAFTWTNVCCRVSGSGYTFTVTCGDSCACGGCSATGYLEYEGYRLPDYGGTRGGHVRIEIRGADVLVPYGGSPLPFEQDLEPGEEVAFKNTYRAVRPSGGESAEASFSMEYV